MFILELLGGLWATVIIGIWFLFLVISVAIDRRSNNHGMVVWGISVIGLIALSIWQREYIFSFETLTNAEFWKPIGVYLLAGVAYAAVEFVLALYKARRYWAEKWATFSTSSDLSGDERDEEFLQRNYYGRSQLHPLVRIKSENGTLTPVIEKDVASYQVGDWIMLWPAHLITMLIGDVLVELLSSISRAFSSIGQFFANLMFRGTFK